MRPLIDLGQQPMKMHTEVTLLYNTVYIQYYKTFSTKTDTSMETRFTSQSRLSHDKGTGKRQTIKKMIDNTVI